MRKKKATEIEIYIPPGPRLGEKVIEATGDQGVWGQTSV